MCANILGCFAIWRWAMIMSLLLIVFAVHGRGSSSHSSSSHSSGTHSSGSHSGGTHSGGSYSSGTHSSGTHSSGTGGGGSYSKSASIPNWSTHSTGSHYSGVGTHNTHSRDYKSDLGRFRWNRYGHYPYMRGSTHTWNTDSAETTDYSSDNVMEETPNDALNSSASSADSSRTVDFSRFLNYSKALKNFMAEAERNETALKSGEPVTLDNSARVALEKENAQFDDYLNRIRNAKSMVEMLAIVRAKPAAEPNPAVEVESATEVTSASKMEAAPEVRPTIELKPSVEVEPSAGNQESKIGAIKEYTDSINDEVDEHANVGESQTLSSMLSQPGITHKPIDAQVQSSNSLFHALRSFAMVLKGLIF